jgi:hypothetical protein
VSGSEIEADPAADADVGAEEVFSFGGLGSQQRRIGQTLMYSISRTDTNCSGRGNVMDLVRPNLEGVGTALRIADADSRPRILEKALAACKRQIAKLVIAKLDRLSRNLAFIATLMDSGVEFAAIDNPEPGQSISRLPTRLPAHQSVAAARPRGVAERDQTRWLIVARKDGDRVRSTAQT